MKTNNCLTIICQTVVLTILLLTGPTAIVKADTPEAKVWDQFEYEYEGQTMNYEIHGLPTDTLQGKVVLISAKDKTKLSGELHIPSTVTYMGVSYSVYRIERDVFDGCNDITSVNIPEGVTYIGGYAFAHCLSLTNITLPDTVTEIGDAAFTGCTALTNIKLPINLKTIGSYTFYKCTGLEDVGVPDGLTTINPDAFAYCAKIKSLYLPETVNNIAAGAFRGTDIVFSVIKDSYAEKFCKSYHLLCTYATDLPGSSISLNSILIKQRQINLFTGGNDSLTVLFYPNNTTDDRTVIWTSKNHEVASVDTNGIVTAISPGTTTITAVIGGLTAECTVVVNPYTPQAVKAVSTGLNSIKISWKAVKGISGYRVYRATSENGVYTRVKDITWNYYKDSTYYEDTDLNDKTTYYYKVRSYSNGTSHYSKAVSARPQIAVPKVTAAAVKDDKIKIQWKWVEGSTGYDIYRSTSKYGVYKLYKKVIDSFYTDTAVTKGKTYYYYVKAYYNNSSKKVYSAGSNKVSALAKTPPTPKSVTIGTTLTNVYKILGSTHLKVYAEGYLELLYRKDFMDSSGITTAHIYLQKVNGDYIVIGWSNLYQGGCSSKVSDGYDQDTGTFTLGSSLTDVFKTMKTPDSFELDFAGGIYYGPGDLTVIKMSFIKFKDGSTISFNSDMKVIGWKNKGCLKLRGIPVASGNASVTVGTSLTDVMKAFGTPKQITENGWGYPRYVYYGDAILTFNHNLALVEWENKGELNITIGDKNQGAPAVQVGSTLDDVIKALGTPDCYYSNGTELKNIEKLTYGSYTIYFDTNQKVLRITKTEGYLTTDVPSVEMNS